MKKLLTLAFAALVAFGASAFKTDTLSISTTLLPEKEPVTVIRPDGNGPFTTVYLLNGFGGGNDDWTNIRPNLGQFADKYGMVMVLPHGRNTWYWDAPADPSLKMESFITKELVPYIDAHYPTIAQREKRAITGLSMGGHGAMWLAVNHPDIFGNVGSTSGGVDIRPFPKNWKMAERLGSKEEYPERWEQYTVINKVPQFKEAQLNIIFDCGTEDFFAEVNNNLHQAFLEAGVKHDYISRPGNHNFDYWRNSILYQLLFFNEAFAK